MAIKFDPKVFLLALGDPAAADRYIASKQSGYKTGFAAGKFEAEFKQKLREFEFEKGEAEAELAMKAEKHPLEMRKLEAEATKTEIETDLKRRENELVDIDRRLDRGRHLANIVGMFAAGDAPGANAMSQEVFGAETKILRQDPKDDKYLIQIGEEPAFIVDQSELDWALSPASTRLQERNRINLELTKMGQGDQLKSDEFYTPNGGIITHSAMFRHYKVANKITEEKDLLVLKAINPAAWAQAVEQNRSAESFKSFSMRTYGVDPTGRERAGTQPGKPPAKRALPKGTVKGHALTEEVIIWHMERYPQQYRTREDVIKAFEELRD